MPAYPLDKNWIYLFKVNNQNTRATYEICSKLIIKTPEQYHWYTLFWYFYCWLWTIKRWLGFCIYDKTHIYTAQKMKFSITDFFSKCDQMHSFLGIWSHLVKKSVMKNFSVKYLETFKTILPKTVIYLAA